MRPLVLGGLILAVLGIVALAVPSFTYFTTERVADAGFFKVDVSRPHTIVLNPIVGGIQGKRMKTPENSARFPISRPARIAVFYSFFAS